MKASTCTFFLVGRKMDFFPCEGSFLTWYIKVTSGAPHLCIHIHHAQHPPPCLGHPVRSLPSLLLLLLLLHVLHRRLDGVFGEHAAVELHGGEIQVVRNLAVFDGGRIVHTLPFDPARKCVRARRCVRGESASTCSSTRQQEDTRIVRKKKECIQLSQAARRVRTSSFDTEHALGQPPCTVCGRCQR